MSHFVVLTRQLPEWKNRVEFDYSLLNSDVILALTNGFMYRKGMYSQLKLLACYQFYSVGGVIYRN